MATPKVYVICDQNCKFESMTKEQILAAITQAVNEGTIGDVDTGFITTIKTINGTPLRFFVGEQSAYDELTEEDKQDLFAIITNDTTKDGIMAALAGVRNDLDYWAESLLTGALAVERANNAVNAEIAEKDGDGRKFADVYATKFDGYIPISNTVVFPSGTIMVYLEPSTATAKHVGDILSSGSIGINGVGDALYATTYGAGGKNKVNQEAIVLGQISNENGHRYLIQFI